MLWLSNDFTKLIRFQGQLITKVNRCGFYQFQQEPETIGRRQLFYRRWSRLSKVTEEISVATEGPYDGEALPTFEMLCTEVAFAELTQQAAGNKLTEIHGKLRSAVQRTKHLDQEAHEKCTFFNGFLEVLRYKMASREIKLYRSFANMSLKDL
jgi:hypothetical protein